MVAEGCQDGVVPLKTRWMDEVGLPQCVSVLCQAIYDTIYLCTTLHLSTLQRRSACFSCLSPTIKIALASSLTRSKVSTSGE